MKKFKFWTALTLILASASFLIYELEVGKLHVFEGKVFLEVISEFYKEPTLTTLFFSPWLWFFFVIVICSLFTFPPKIGHNVLLLSLGLSFIVQLINIHALNLVIHGLFLLFTAIFTIKCGSIENLKGFRRQFFNTGEG